MVERYFWHEYLGFAAKMPEPPGIRSKPTGCIPTKFAGKKKGTTNAMKETVTYQQKWAIVTHYRQHGIAQTLAAYYPNAQGKHRELKRFQWRFEWCGRRRKGWRWLHGVVVLCKPIPDPVLAWYKTPRRIFGIKRLDFCMPNLIYLF